MRCLARGASRSCAAPAWRPDGPSAERTGERERVPGARAFVTGSGTRARATATRFFFFFAFFFLNNGFALFGPGSDPLTDVSATDETEAYTGSAPLEPIVSRYQDHLGLVRGTKSKIGDGYDTGTSP